MDETIKAERQNDRLSREIVDQVLSEISDRLEEGLKRFPLVPQLGLYVIPVEGLPKDCAVVLRQESDGEFDLTWEVDPDEGTLSCTIQVEVLKIVRSDEHGPPGTEQPQKDGDHS